MSLPRRARAGILVALLVPCAACSSGRSDRDLGSTREDIIGGTLSGVCEWPTVVSAGCSAVLVHPRAVLIAAHCLTGAMGAPTEVRFGESESDPALTVPVDRCVRHPSFDGQTSEYDLGVCLLDRAVDGVPIVPVWSAEDGALVPGASLEVVGFGATGVSDAATTGEKRSRQLVLGAKLSPNTWEVGTGVRATCYGDSGGPAFAQNASGQWRVFGVLSGDTGEPCASSAIYVSVAALVPWLESAAGVDLTSWKRRCDASLKQSSPNAAGAGRVWSNACASAAGTRCDRGDRGASTGNDAGTLDAASPEAGAAPARSPDAGHVRDAAVDQVEGGRAAVAHTLDSSGCSIAASARTRPPWASILGLIAVAVMGLRRRVVLGNHCAPWRRG